MRAHENCCSQPNEKDEKLALLMITSFGLHHIVVTHKDDPGSVFSMLPITDERLTGIRMTWLELLRQEKVFQNQVSYKVYVAMLSLGRQVDEIYENTEDAKKGQQMVYINSIRWNRDIIFDLIDKQIEYLNTFKGEQRFDLDAVHHYWDLIQLSLISSAVIPDYGGDYYEASTMERHSTASKTACKSFIGHCGYSKMGNSGFETP